jgi:hypothetical protein
MFNTFISFFRSPLNVVGFAIAIATAGYTAWHEIVLHTFAISVFLPGEVSGLFLMIFPDKTLIASDAVVLTQDVIAEWALKNPAGFAKVLADVVKIANDLNAPVPAPPTTPVIVPVTPVTRTPIK